MSATNKFPFEADAADHKHPHLFKLKVKLVHTKNQLGKFKNLANPNHRHDEPHEQRVDAERRKIAESHRYNSFAPVTAGNRVKFYIDARDYFWAVSGALEDAKEVIYIADWWLSPELYLRRPPAFQKEWRLDRVLKRKAERGVKIYVIVYKEISQAISCNSWHTKHSLEHICPHGTPGHGNIIVMRHPDHSPFKHGADMTFYWAHHEKFIVIDHEIAFVGGIDLCFGRWDTHQHPLADLHSGGIEHEVWPGQDFNNNRVLDFQKVEDWKQNQLDKKSYGRMPWHDVSIGFRGPAVMHVAEHFVGRWNFVKRDKYKRKPKYPWLQLSGISDELMGCEHPSFPVGGYIRHPLSRKPSSTSSAIGDCEVQLVRSASDWSHGIQPHEQSIQNAYIDVISHAQNFVYIENQFFITATGEEQKPITNQIGAAIVKAVVRAHEQKRKFRVIIIIPAIPGFPGDLREDSAMGTRAIIDYQYKSLCRGEHSIYGRLEAMGINPREYIFPFNLRIYDRINVTPELKQHEEEASVKYLEAQKNHADQLLGAMNGSEGPTNPFPTPHRHEHPPDNPDSIAATAMNLSTEVNPLEKSKSSLAEDYVQEELYVHAKVLIVDDEVLVIGSSNINDRSQLGTHDSELSAVVRHKPTVSTLRKALWREHLGLSSPQRIDAGEDDTALPPQVESISDPEIPEIEELQDPLDDRCWEKWVKQAKTNTDVYRELFHADPDDGIRTWKDYDSFCPSREQLKAGHSVEKDPGTIRKTLARVKGHLVVMPEHFLEEEELAERGLQVNKITESIYA